MESALQAVVYENCNYFRNQHFSDCGDLYVDELFSFLAAFVVTISPVCMGYGSCNILK